MPKKGLHVLVLFSFSFVTAARATSIVAIWGGGQVVVAADSKIEDGKRENSCKLVVQNGMVAAFSGLAIIEPWFDARDMIRRSMTKNVANPLSAVLQDFENNLFVEMRRDIPRSVWTVNHNEHLRIVLTGSRNGELAMQSAYYDISRSGQTKRVRFRSLPDPKVGPDELAIDSLGADEGVKAMDNNQDKGKTIEAYARKILEAQFTLTPARSGPPISIIRIARNGNVWINKGVCP